MSGNSPGIVYPSASHRLIPQGARAKPRVHLILRSDAQHRVSKDGPERFARFAHAGAPFEAPSGRLRARGGELLRTRAELR
jgi:hypothetical protein